MFSKDRIPVQGGATVRVCCKCGNEFVPRLTVLSKSDPTDRLCPECSPVSIEVEEIFIDERNVGQRLIDGFWSK